MKKQQITFFDEEKRYERKVKFRKNGKSLKMRTSLHRKIPMLVGLRKTTRFILDTKITLNAMPTVN